MIEKDVYNDDSTSPLFIGANLFEADDKVWQLVLGYLSDNRPRFQAKRLLEKAHSPTIEEDDEDREFCVYLKNLDKKIPEFIAVTPVPEIKPCPSLQLMTDTPFSNVQEFCDQDHLGCGEYATMTNIEDRGTHWLFYSFAYKNEATAVLDTETLKKKAYAPIIEEGMCLYFLGLTKEGQRGIVAIQDSNNATVEKNLNVSAHVIPNTVRDLLAVARFLQ